MAGAIVRDVIASAADTYTSRHTCHGACAGA